ncbi:alpha/beta fold hydrolase [Alkalicoccobacillus murimartini]|uniref:Pimeloyl-ACP methyl ester carboxylesterase n=1 Tax=Alkalicoccobacillus murimartini TaxID=171685 RepID=A0ABT9YE62_9BACI|nr:alpha/beta hydrolase [Alkalicoccobacillus murimartini]MDQ0205785.1 pimeloyl-ACP methyl ester carboxylesterase [Alkalicoccobacillus murimartini]
MYSYVDMGDKSKDVLVLIHGLGSKKESWRYQFELANHYRVIAPDLRGHGDSDINEGISIRHFAEDIIDLLQKLDIQQAHICGLSLGGIVAQEILKIQPEIVQSLILSNTTSFIPHIFGWQAVDERRRKLETLSDDDYERHVLTLCLNQSADEALLDEIRSYYFKINRLTYMEAATSAVGINYTTTLLYSSKPILIIGSIYDRITYYVNALTIRFSAPHSTLKTFHHSSHIPNVEEPKVYNATVSTFIQQLSHKQSIPS